MTVQSTRRRRQSATPSRESEAKRKIDILPIREKLFVEAAEIYERFRAVSSRAAAWAEWVGRPGQLLYGTIPQLVPRLESGVELDPGGVD